MNEIERIRELEAEVAELKVKLKNMTKQRNLYRRDLLKERESQNDPFLAGLEAALSPLPVMKPTKIVDADQTKLIED